MARQPWNPTLMNRALEQYLKLCQSRVEQALEARLPSNTILPQKLHKAMRYSVLNGGKRMRPLLTYGTGVALGINPDALDGVACAVEIYSCLLTDP